jgi:hypothetical protein
VIFFFLLRISQYSFYASKLCDPAIVIDWIPKVPKWTKLPNYYHCLPQASKNPVHIISSNPTIIQKTASSKEGGSLSSTCHCVFSPFLSFCFLHKLLSAHLIQYLHKDSICQKNILTRVLKGWHLSNHPTNCQVFQLIKSIFFPKTFCTTNIPAVLSTDSWGQPFRFLTQLLFSMWSPTMQISATVQQT